MLPSSNNDRSLFDSMFKRPSNSFLDDPKPNYTTQDDLLHDPAPLFFSNFSSPFFDEHELPLNHQILSQPTSENRCVAIPSLDRFTTTEQSKSMEIVEFTSDLKKDRGSNSNPNPKGTNVRKKSVLGIVPRRRAGKKDRHSKICTAQGIRDRRMRLSLQAARKFFDLQDLLGYDKASKTIEWLFDKSKNAIAELAKDHSQTLIRMSISTDANSESLISECEVVSGIKSNSKNDARDTVVTSVRSNLDSNNFAIQEERKQSQEYVVTSKPNQTRESRERARARARCRTLQKMMIKSIDEYSDHHGLRSNPSEGLKLSNPNDCYLQQKLGSCSNILFEGADRYTETSNLIQERGFTKYGVVFENEQLNDVGTLENLIGNKSSSSSSSSCAYSDVFYSSVSAISGYSDPNTNLMEYMGNWDVFNNEKVNNFQYHFTSTQASLAENPNSNHSVKIPDLL